MGRLKPWFTKELFVRESVHSLILDEAYLFMASQLQVKDELLSLLKPYPKLEVEYG